jgi:tRNA G18 (ribose-2'-O)-methylase SpoU
MGSAFRLALRTVATGAAAVAEARERGLAVMALTPARGTSIYDTDLRGPVAMLIGSEGSGLDPALIRAADLQVSIPMNPAVESLNVAVAAAVALYEARRQRLGRA